MRPESSSHSQSPATLPLSPGPQALSTALYEAPAPSPPAPVVPLERCPDCGQDIRALTTIDCPACGVNVLSALRRRESNRAGRVELLESYRAALVPLVISYALLAASIAVFGDPGDAAWFALRQSFFVPVAVGVFLMSSITWLGRDRPLLIGVLRLITAIAISDLAGFFMWWVPILFMYQVVVTLVLMGMIVKLLELEYQEGMILGLVLGALRYIIHVGLAQWVG